MGPGILEMAAPATYALGVVALLVACSAGAASQDYPNRPLRLVTPVLAGGGADATVRLLANKLSEAFNQRVVVDNRPGASNIIGTDIVAKATPDGYTILWVSSTHAINAGVRRGKLPFDPLNDFAAITLFAKIPFILVVHPSLPVKNVRELIAFAKARPGDILFAGSGSGSTPHLAGELFKTQTNTKMVHVPYRGTGPAITAILSGEVSTMFMPALTALPLIQSGRVRALGVTSLERLPALPELPTVSESGLKGYQSSQWYGVLAPAGTSPDILNVLNGHTVRIMQSADMKERMKNSGSVAVGSSREVFAKFLQTEFSKWAQVIKASGATVD